MAERLVFPKREKARPFIGSQTVLKFIWNPLQEARRILIAQMQNFVYSEFLPALLSEKCLEKHDLKLGFDSQYQDDVDPTTRNEFATAAFRFGHSIVQVNK